MRTNRMPVLTRLLKNFFRWNGHMVADHPIATIALMILVTVIASVKIVLTPMEDDFSVGYTPADARAFREMQVYNRFGNGQLVMLFVFVTARDGGNLMRMEYLNETIDLMDDIATNIKQHNQSFYDFCDHFCGANEPTRLFRNGLLLFNSASNGSDQQSITDRMNLKFPIFTIFGQQFDMTRSFFGVTTMDDCAISPNMITNIKNLTMIGLIYRANLPEQWSVPDLHNWNNDIAHYCEQNFKDTKIVPRVISFPYIQAEIVRTAKSLFPYLSVGFAIMCVCSIASVYIGTKMTSKWSYYKLNYAINACISPLMASASSLGILFWLGFRFGSVLLVTPFLTLAIGVDDAFIMINAWERLITSRLKNREADDSIRKWAAELLMDVGPSITITSVTNMLAFGIGALVPIPEVRLFCIANGFSMFMDLVFSVTIHMAVLVVCEKFENRQQKWTKETYISANRRDQIISNFFLEYCEWLTDKFTRFMLLNTVITYWAISIYGLTKVEPGLTPTKLFVSDSPLIETEKLRLKYFYPQYTFITVFVSDVGNLSDANYLGRIKAMVDEFEAVEDCYGPQFTLLWMRAYEKFMSMGSIVEIEDVEYEQEQLDDDNTFKLYSPKSIQTFLDWEENKQWRGFIQLDPQTHRLSTFFFMVTYRINSQSVWPEKLRMLTKWRAIVDRYEDLSASVFDDNAQFLDQITTLLPLTAQNSVITIFAMILVCFIFMQDVTAVAIAAFSILSIFVGVFGILTLWQIDLDPISMTALMFTIGMSVEFSAHISYHYNRIKFENDDLNAVQAMSKCLTMIAYPLLQCSIATILYIFCVLLVDCYMSQIFFKSVVVVILLGIWHALILIPAVLCALPVR